MRPTLRAVLLFGVGAPLSLALILIDETLWTIGFAYLGSAILVIGADGLRALPGRILDIDVTAPGILYIGDTGDLLVTLSVPGEWPDSAMEIACDVSDNLANPPHQRVRLVAGQQTRVAVPLAPKRRGTARIHRLWLRWHGPLRLMLRQRIHPVDADVPVVPNVGAVRDNAIRISSWDSLFGFKPQSQQGDGSEFEALRDYVPGLDHRSIDWKHSARHHTLVCKEFRAERNHQIILAFDTGHLMSEPLGGIPKLDHAINAGLLLSYMSLRSDDRVGIFGFDSQVRLFAAPVCGVHNFWRLQRISADLEYRHEETNFTLGLADLLGRLKRRSVIILQTEFVDTVTAELMVENLERLAARHLVVFITLQDPGLHATVDAPPRSVGAVARSVIADDFIRERMVVFEKLRRLGVLCLDAPSERVGVELINRYMMIKRRELV